MDGSDEQSGCVFAVVFTIVLLAEVIATINRSAGLFLHFAAVFIAVLYVVFLKKGEYVLSLTLPSILRIVNFSMPVFFPYTIYWLPLVYSPIFISVYAAARALGLEVEDLGLNLRRLYFYVPAGAVIGCALSLIEFRILQPDCLIPDFSIESTLTLCVVMYAFVALAEELVFRSVVQSTLEKEFSLLKGLLFATILFAAMHTEYGLPEVTFAFFTGLLIGFLFQKTRSLAFIVAIHGTLNVMIFGFLHMTTGITLPWS